MLFWLVVLRVTDAFPSSCRAGRRSPIERKYKVPAPSFAGPTTWACSFGCACAARTRPRGAAWRRQRETASKCTASSCEQELIADCAVAAALRNDQLPPKLRRAQNKWAGKTQTATGAAAAAEVKRGKQLIIVVVV